MDAAAQKQWGQSFATLLLRALPEADTLEEAIEAVDAAMAMEPTWRPETDGVKPDGCICKDYPRTKLRNGSGHQPECPYHKSWLEQGGFNRNKPPDLDAAFSFD